MSNGTLDGLSQLAISSAIRNVAARVPDKIVIEDEVGCLTSRQLVDRMNRLGVVAKEHWKLVPGDVVALITPNRYEYVEIVAGLSDVGIIVATLNPRMTAFELQGILVDCEPKVAIIDPALELLAESLRDAKVPVVIPLDQEYESLLRMAQPRRLSAAVLEDASFSICYTSGTTGAPKGVLLSHRSRALSALGSAVEYKCFGRNDRFLAMTPLCHGAGFAFALAAVSFGGTCVLFNRLEADSILARLGEGDISGVFMVPTHFKRLFEMPKRKIDNCTQHHSLSAIISNAAALPQELKELTVGSFGEGILYEAYGSTEAGIVTTLTPEDMLRKQKSVGTPFLNTEVEIRREDGTLCLPGEIGNLHSRSPYTFNGYFNKPLATSETLVNGWVTVQDLAFQDEDGFITIAGRMKDMIVSGGMNIYPAEIEEVLLEQPTILEAAVVGVPDEEWGERPHAFIVVKPGLNLAENEILSACRTKLSGNKVPESVTVVDELPRNASGKVLKRRLRELHSSQLN